MSILAAILGLGFQEFRFSEVDSQRSRGSSALLYLEAIGAVLLMRGPMITRYEETPGALETAIQEALNGRPSKAVLVFHRDVNGVHLASTIIRAHFQCSENVLRVEVGMSAREGNPFEISTISTSLSVLVDVVGDRIERILN